MSIHPSEHAQKKASLSPKNFVADSSVDSVNLLWFVQPGSNAGAMILKFDQCQFKTPPSLTFSRNLPNPFLFQQSHAKPYFFPNNTPSLTFFQTTRQALLFSKQHFKSSLFSKQHFKPCLFPMTTPSLAFFQTTRQTLHFSNDHAKPCLFPTTPPSLLFFLGAVISVVPGWSFWIILNYSGEIRAVLWSN
jgi:hypothetical protein